MTLKVGFGAEADIETVLDSIEKSTFAGVQKPTFIIFHLETIGLSNLFKMFKPILIFGINCLLCITIIISNQLFEKFVSGKNWIIVFL